MAVAFRDPALSVMRARLDSGRARTFGDDLAIALVIGRRPRTLRKPDPVAFEQVGGETGRALTSGLTPVLVQRMFDEKGANHALDNGLHRQLLTRRKPSITKEFPSFVRRPP